MLWRLGREAGPGDSCGPGGPRWQPVWVGRGPPLASHLGTVWMGLGPHGSSRPSGVVAFTLV